MKIYTYLCGGLGNQMFQYATARSLALSHRADLVLDNWSGFVRDLQYRRHYELHALPISGRTIQTWETLPIWLHRLEKRFHTTHSFIEHHWYGQFIAETELAYLKQLNGLNLNSSFWLLGYWQSPLYFKNHTDTLLRELTPPPPTAPRFLSLGQQLREDESVALGVRLYEESANPSMHTKGGVLKTPKEINNAILQLLSQCPNARFFIFCTHRSPILEKLNLPENSVFVTHDDGYEGTLERMWLLSQCRHHVFTNSSYYWWGAWLSQKLYDKQLIFAADNFINSDSFCHGWERF